MRGYIKEIHATGRIPDNILRIRVTETGLEYNLSSDPIFCGKLSYKKLNRDSSSNNSISHPHAIIGVGIRYDNTPFVFDFFRHSYPTKTTTGHVVASSLGLRQGFYLARPWQDSPTEDWIVFASAKSIIINDIEQTETIKTINGNGLTDIVNMLPSIDLYQDNGQIFVQLLNPDGSKANKENIEIYLETNTGLLQQTVLLSDKTGLASTNLLFASKGKVKAGFKFYSGKAEIQID